jgi:hypothetical protein
MRHWVRRSVRSLIYALGFLLPLPAVLAGTIQVRERILRHRAERLLDDFRSVEMRHTTFQQIGDLAARWNGFARHDVPCSKEHCDFTISLGELDLGILNPRLFRIVLHLYRLVGGHDALVGAMFNVRNGFVWGETYEMDIDAPPTPDGEYTLAGRLTTSPASEPTRLVWPSLRKHAEYEIGGPAGCLGCVMAWVQISPFVDPEDVRRLSQFDFSCLTRVAACRTKEDIMPVAMAESKADALNGSEQPNCDVEATQILRRDLDNVAVADVVDNRAVPDYPTDEKRILKVRLVERLKRAFFWEPNSSKDVVASVALALSPLNDLKNIRAGDRIIILFNAGPGVVPYIGAEMCGVVPYTERNFAFVRQAAAQDDRVPPLIEYSQQYRPRKFSDPPLPPPPPPPPFRPARPAH